MPVHEEEIIEGLGAGEEEEGAQVHEEEIADGLGVGEAVAGAQVHEEEITEGLGLGAEAEAFNFGAWLRANKDLCTIRYIFTLTGTADGKVDIELPIQSFQSRWRSGNPTYLQVVIPAITAYASYVNDRPNGELKIDMAYFYKGVEALREQLLLVDMEEIRLDQGFRSESITLVGHKTETYTAKTVALTGVTYRYEAGGYVKLRTAVPNLYLRPGDTVIYDTDEFVADLITLWIDQRQTMMEVSEAA